MIELFCLDFIFYIYVSTNRISLSLVFLALGYENIAPLPLSLERFCFGTHSSGMQALFFFSLFLPQTLPSHHYFLLAPIQSQPVDATRWITTFVDVDVPENSSSRKSFYLRRDIITFTQASTECLGILINLGIQIENNSSKGNNFWNIIVIKV